MGTGITALTIASRLLSATPPLAIQLTLIDKAAQPGGRLTSRTYDSGVVLETGARVFETPRGSEGEGAFGKEVERWRNEGWVREVESSKRKGLMGEGRWWEGVGGITKGLVAGLLAEVKAAADGRLQLHYGIEVSSLSQSRCPFAHSFSSVQATNPTPVALSSPLQLSLKTPLPNLPPISLLVHTAPSPQVSVLLPTFHPSPTPYIKTFALLLPTLSVPNLPVYHRDPHPLLTSIATGLPSPSSSQTDSAGLVIQSTPEKLGLGYTKDEASDEVVRAAFFAILSEARLLPTEILERGAKLAGRDSQVKRWKFAQVERAIDWPPAVRGVEEEVVVMEGGRVILAGDGTAGGAGGIAGAWRAGVRASDVVRSWLEKEKSARL